jgi:hypothetical protein
LHPIHEFNNKDVKQIETDLRKWFPPPIRHRFQRLPADLAPREGAESRAGAIIVMVISDGVPDARRVDQAGLPAPTSGSIQSPITSKNVTVHLSTRSKVGDNWRKPVARSRGLGRRVRRHEGLARPDEAGC